MSKDLNIEAVWDTHLVCVEGHPVGYVEGPLPAEGGESPST
jgi:hypothetical protein